MDNDKMKSNMLTKIWTELKKFGLEYDDFPTIIDNIGLLMWVLTINIQKKWTQSINWVFYLMTTIAFSSYFYVYVFSMLWLVCFHYGKDNVQATSVILAIGINSIISGTKIIFMKLNADKIRSTVQNFLNCDSQVTPNTRFAKNLRKNLRVVKKRSLIIWTTFAANGLAYLILPLVRPGRHFTIDFFLLYGLEPMTETPNYEIATIIFTITSGFAVYSMVSIAIYVLVIVGYNEAQMYALSEELRNVWDDSLNFYDKIKRRINDKRHVILIRQQVTNEFIRVRLRDVTKLHIENINLLYEFNREFRVTLALEYTLLAIAIIAELLGGLEHTYLALPYTIVQMLMDCLAGQRVIDASDDFEKSVYSCRWENFNTSNQRTVLLMLVMSQRTMILSAGGFATLNYSFLMAILKTSYSTYTTLESTVKKNA